MGFFITSPVFASGQAIPARFTRDGENISPPLVWNGAPERTRSFILMLEDPIPAPPVRYWLAYDITVSHLPEGAGSNGSRGALIRHGRNDFGRLGYDGPAPPPDETYHPFYFRLAALSVEQLDVEAGAPAALVWDAARRHVLEEAELSGIYTRTDLSANLGAA